MSVVKTSVRLPKTPFGMKANLAETEPKTLEFWQKTDIYRALQRKNMGKPAFILHDGPPYANGHLHMGHALNKILKDIVVKYKAMQGYAAPFTPGWDCHGLPIEWMVEAEFKAKGQAKEDISVADFRAACRLFADKWVQIQSKEFQRLGVFGDWDTPYLTMTRTSERLIAEKLFAFLMNGGLYKSVKPVYWSVVEQTALAEAEVEYKDKTSESIYVGFPIIHSAHPDLIGAQAAIWTTTPWTLPANRAIAYHPDVTYILATYQSDQGKRTLLIAEALKEAVQAALSQTLQTSKRFLGADLAGTVVAHPWRGKGYDFDVPLLPGAHVTLEQGTGLVHTAPGHGVEDFQLGQQFDLEVAQPVGDDGVYYAHVPLWAGEHVYKVHDKIIAALQDVGALLAHHQITHSYPHSWRSKAPLIFRTTPQWFISMAHNDLRGQALKTIDATQWIPAAGRNRLASMVQGRPDWCVSRQRVWGIPLPVFVHKSTQEILKDHTLNEKILKRISEQGTDFWFEPDAKQELLADRFDPDMYEKSTDILDVWFESGCSYAFINPDESASHLPIDLYLEGSDQHRGWFQSSLLVAVGADQKYPYKTVLTHGFIVDEQGYKLSKSKGNAVNLDDVQRKDGVDVLRLWVAGSDYQDDMRLGKNILKFQQENYRKIRNILRFLLGNLPENTIKEPLNRANLPVLERYTLAQLAQVLDKCHQHLEAYNIHAIYRELFGFCVDLSSFYFDIRKDVLYCESQTSVTYQSTLFVLQKLFDALVCWLAPILSFTAEEAWQTRFPGESVFLQELPKSSPTWHDPELVKRLEACRHLRVKVNGLLERARADKIIGSSLEASVSIALPHDWKGFRPSELIATFSPEDWADFFIVSGVAFVAAEATTGMVLDESGLALRVDRFSGSKCERCWKYYTALTAYGNDQEKVCQRCYEVLDA